MAANDGPDSELGERGLISLLLCLRLADCCTTALQFHCSGIYPLRLRNKAIQPLFYHSHLPLAICLSGCWMAGRLVGLVLRTMKHFALFLLPTPIACRCKSRRGVSPPAPFPGSTHSTVLDVCADGLGHPGGWDGVGRGWEMVFNAGNSQPIPPPSLPLHEHDATHPVTRPDERPLNYHKTSPPPHPTGLLPPSRRGDVASPQLPCMGECPSTPESTNPTP